MNQTIYPIGIQNFEKIRMDGYLYVDKTAAMDLRIRMYVCIQNF